MPDATAVPEMEVRWGDKKVQMFRFPEEGSLIGHVAGTKKFLYIPLSVDGTCFPDELGSIDNVDDDETFVAKLNTYFGTNVTIHDFPGR
jgi:hypothetical protein